MAGRPVRRARLAAEELRRRQEEQAILARGSESWWVRILAGTAFAFLLILNLAALGIVHLTQWGMDKLSPHANLDT